MRADRISIEKISCFLRKYYFWILGVIFFLLLCLNAFVYYQYVYLTMNIQPEVADERVEIDGEALNKVIDDINKRGENLNRVKKGSYFNPFTD